MKLKQLLLVIAVSVVSAFAGVFLYAKFARGGSTVGAPTDGKLPANYAAFFDSNGMAAEPTDFTKASQSAIPAVVHIKTKIPAKKLSNNLPNRGRSGDPFDDFFGDMFGVGPQIQPEQKASGSGVIISQDGYIVTNNHVISDGAGGVAPEIKVTLNEGRKVYAAKVIGRDPSTDLAVLKVDANNLPYMIYGNSDDARIGQWVLAVGYPFNLEATVTAGIISAKGRNIGINAQQSMSPVESFLQTDAAVNPGNSGGPLINTNGQLLGINSAILAPTGTYAGYSFAIPVNIVKKVVNDIIKYGDVKRGYIGISYAPTDQQNDHNLRGKGLQSESGVYVLGVSSNGGAAKAGIKAGDVVTKINGTDITSVNQMGGTIASAQPGDKVKLSYLRGGKEYTSDITLTEKPNDVKISSGSILSDQLGVDLETVEAKRAAQLRIPGGVEIKNIRANGLLSKSRIDKGFIITSVNGQSVKTVDDLAKVLSGSRSSTVQFDGIYPGYSGQYSYQINLNGDGPDEDSSY